MIEPIEAASAHDMLHLLTRLRRKGATVERDTSAGATAWQIMIPGTRRLARSPSTVDARLVAYARDHGWLTSDGRGDRLRLTEAGALKLTSGLNLSPQRLPAGTLQPAAALSKPRRQSPKRDDASPGVVARLRRQKGTSGKPLIAGDAAEAAERLAVDFMKGQMMPRVTANWDKAMLGQRPKGMAPGFGIEVRDQIADAQARVRRALDHVGHDNAGILIDVCCLDRGLEDVEAAREWPRGCGRIVLGIALAMLAKHYGIVTEGPERGRTSRWGTGDDKPTLEAWMSQAAPQPST